MADSRISTLLRWYRSHGRSLPWRNTRNPYRIFVSEMMLQQTQVSRVIPFYHTWLRRFPTWTSLARASTNTLVRAWSGLGYNRRALYMRQAAQQVIQKGVPKTVDEWELLQGVGPYAARAIHTFTQRTLAIGIDTNIRRVVGRLFLRTPYPDASDDPRITRAIESVTHPQRHWDLLHALMDLGALYCKATKPNCATCPLRKTCPLCNDFLQGRIKRRKAQTPRERITPGKPFPDRIYRGRILTLLQSSPCTFQGIAHAIDDSYDQNRDAEWLARIIARLMKEGFLMKKGMHYQLSTK